MTRSIIAFIAFMISGGLFVGYTRPTYDSLQGVQSTIAQYDMALSRAAELQKKKKELFDIRDRFNPDDVARLYKMLPDHVDNVRLVLDIDSMATRHQMSIQNVVVNSSLEKEKTPTIGGGASSALKFDSITLRFSTDGTYADFSTFLTEMETSLRIVDVIALSVTQGPLQTGPEPLYHYDVTIRTYWLR